MKPRILNLEPEGYSPRAWKILKSFSRVENGPLTHQELLDCISEYDAIVVRLGHKIDNQVLKKATRLKVIASATTGLNHIDCNYAKIKEIAILSLQGETQFLDSIPATAEHTWGLVLSLVRHIPASMQHVCNYGWDRDAFKGSELFGKTLGIIGYGRLGKKVARYGIAFGMQVLAYDNKQFDTEANVNLVPMRKLLSCSDIVSLHIPYNASTHAFIGRDEINTMKPGSLIVNTSRGEVIDEAALLKSLKEGHLVGAALDVMSGENSGNPLWMNTDPLITYAKKHGNLLITPHLGGCTCESMEKTEVFIVKKLKKYFENKGLDYAKPQIRKKINL
jgi:D-3-phosphoglycerate dehydrogenase